MKQLLDVINVKQSISQRKIEQKAVSPKTNEQKATTNSGITRRNDYCT